MYAEVTADLLVVSTEPDHLAVVRVAVVRAALGVRTWDRDG